MTQPGIATMLRKIGNELVGTSQTLSGALFSRTKELPEREYEVKDIRVGRATVVNLKKIREEGKSDYEHPTFELLVKGKGMKSARWTRPFPIREINLKLIK